MKSSVINIMGKTYAIHYKDLKEHDACGMTDNLKAIITVDQSLKDSELVHTLLHEFFHGVLHRVGASQALTHGLEEVIVDSIATFLVDHYDFELK